MSVDLKNQLQAIAANLEGTVGDIYSSMQNNRNMLDALHQAAEKGIKEEITKAANGLGEVNQTLQDQAEKQTKIAVYLRQLTR
jgi:hypothetical protein